VFERFSERILRTVVWTQREVVWPGCVRLLKLAVVEASETRLHTRALGASCSDSFVWCVAVRARRPGGRPGSEMWRDVESNPVISTKPKRDQLAGTVNYGAIIEGVAGVLKNEEFRLLEKGVRRVGEHVLSGFPAVREVTVRVAKLRVPVARTVSGVSVEVAYRR
jgi:dihydroneopterin aldolase